MTDRPVVLEVRGVSKTFRIPTHRVDSLKERATHPLRRVEYREQQALRDISFDVHQGEFLGIVGRNGSGKSTLLKILSSIYQADHGRIRVAGRLAPFIELGVGFDPELTSAREHRPQRRDDGPRPARGRAPPGLGARLRRPARVRRPEAQELLVRDDGAAGFRRDGRGRRRHHARRRGARRRRRRVRAEVHGRLPAPGGVQAARSCSSPTTWRRSRHVRPRDADRGGAARLPGRPSGDGAALLPRQLRARPRQLASRTRPAPSGTSTSSRSTRGSRTPSGERVENVAAGRADRPADRARSAARSGRRRSSASTSSTRWDHIDLRLQPLSDLRARSAAAACPPAGACASAGTVQNRLLPGRYFVQCFVARSREQGDVRDAPSAAAGVHRRRHPHGKGIVAVDADVEAEVEL